MGKSDIDGEGFRWCRLAELLLVRGRHEEAEVSHNKATHIHCHLLTFRWTRHYDFSRVVV